MNDSGWTKPGYEAVARIVAARAGLAFTPNRRDDAEAKMRRAMTKAGTNDLQRYLQLLEQSSAALDALIAELTVGETYFFRETTQFAFIRREVLPEIVARRGASHGVRVWSAGCASGEEAYSLAIVLDEAGLLRGSHIVGSDVSRPALARADEALYGAWSLRGVDEGLIGRYFRAAGDRFALDERIKKAVSFGYLNLAQDVYPSLAGGIWGMDLILCRNVLIYFGHEAVKSVAERLHASLAPGGWLIAGPSDPPLSDLAAFETVIRSEGVFYRKATEGRLVFSAQSAPAAPLVPEPEAPPRLTEAAEAANVAPADPLAGARRALAAGDYESAFDLARGQQGPEAAEIAVRASANRDGTEVAVDLAKKAARQHALSVELQFLFAVLLVDLGRFDEAAQALRRVLYLDRSLALAHFVLGTVLIRSGELAGARRAFTAAADLAAACDPRERVPLGDGEPAGRLAVAARAQADLLRDQSAS